MKKNLPFMLASMLLWGCVSVSCPVRGKAADAPADLPEIQAEQKNHVWYYFTEAGFEQTDLPQNAPEIVERPWTEAVRIASCGTSPVQKGQYEAYALVNHLGMIGLNGQASALYQDASIFTGVTADSVVFSEGAPVFYLYRSTFFNKDLEKGVTETVQPSRPFLVEFDPQASLFFPLVSYGNMNLGDDDQIVGYFWDGRTWACASKRMTDMRVEFSFFNWEPHVALTELSPALTSTDLFSFSGSNEDAYRTLNMPRPMERAPEALKSLVQAIPREFSFNVYWRDDSGTSPVQYFQQGSGAAPLSAYAAEFPRSGYVVALFSDGTTYVQAAALDAAFRLPLLPPGYAYGDFCVTGDTLYAAWEQTSFYKTGRSGFIRVNLAGVLAVIQ